MWLLIYVLFLHWIGDYCLQTPWMANNKSKEFLPLLVHVLVYALVLALGLSFLGQHYALMLFVASNFALHICTDFVTSKFNSYCKQKNWIWMFFIGIGFDQFIHAACLLGTTAWLLGVKP